MGDFSKHLDTLLSPYHLLKHPFYEAWNSGKLTQEIIKDYAVQYYQHVKSFPRYISATHSVCEDIGKRKILLENLVDEENNGTDHPTLWKEFALGMGNTEKELVDSKSDSYTENLVNTFFKYCRKSYAEGLASLYAYEYQIPEISRTKIDGLKKFYDICDDKTLQFFYVHEKADIWHREQCSKLLRELSAKEQKLAETAAINTAKSLWGFLSGIENKHKLHCC